jgi:hypothetical protein
MAKLDALAVCIERPLASQQRNGMIAGPEDSAAQMQGPMQALIEAPQSVLSTLPTEQS